MNSYASHSLSLRKEISEIARQSLALIAKLDKKIRTLVERLDDKLKMGKDEQSPDDVEEIELLKKAIDATSLRKVQLAAKCYDIIDQNIKLMDLEMGSLENKLRLTVPEDTMENNGRKRKYCTNSITEEGTEDGVSNVVYCLCRDPSNADMLACDNEDCHTKWFHYKCVGLLKKPRNSWICPSCSSSRRVS